MRDARPIDQDIWYYYSSVPNLLEGFLNAFVVF